MLKGYSSILTTSTVELLIGDDYTLTPTVSYQKQEYTNATYTFASRNQQVATVDANGKITAVALGSAEIEISANWGTYTNSIYLKKIVNVAVKEDVTLQLDSDPVSLNPGDTETLTAIATFEGNDVSNAIVWQSSDNEIATVVNGVVTAGNKFGTAQITFSYTTPNATYTSNPVSVTVEKPIYQLKDVVFDFDLSKGNALDFNGIDGVNGAVEKVSIDDVDVTSTLEEGAMSYEKHLNTL